jgi:uncharacterized protein YjbI with pentapeptide repeats
MSSQIPNIGPGADLRGIDLSGYDLTDSDLEGANLEGANLEGANLEGAGLLRSYLEGAHLERANLQDALLSWANLRGANLTGANLTEADLTGADLTDAIFNEEELSEIQKRQIKNSNQSRRILEEILSISDISNLKQRQNQIGRLQLRNANLNCVYLEGAHLEGAHLEGAYLERAYLEGAHLEGAHLEGAYLEGAILLGAQLQRAHIEGAFLEAAHLERADLIGAHLQGANLRGVFLREADLTNADLERANLQDAILSWVNLRGAHLTGANLTGADLTGAYLTGAILNEEELSEIQKRQIRQSEHSRRILEQIRAISDISNLKQRQNQLGRLQLRDANLNYAYLEGAHLRGADLRKANLKEANLEHATLSEANLERANLEKAFLHGAYLNEANLEGVNMREAYLGKAYLEKAILRRVDLTGADLRKANLEGAILRRVDLTGADLRKANLEGAILEEVNFTGVDLRKAILYGTRLEYANLTEVNLERAYLEGAHLRGSDLTRAVLTEVDLQDSNLTEVNLTRANLRGANLQYANLQNSNLTGADLTGADLRVVNLTGAILTEANLEGANLEGTYLTDVILSDIQRQQIETSILAREQERINSASIHPSILDSSENEFYRTINISRQIRLPIKNSANNSCPSYKPLYDFIMVTNLDGNFRFHFEGESGRDASGLTKIVFDFILPVYRKLYFYMPKGTPEGTNFILLKPDLKNGKISELQKDTSQIIKLARAAKCQIYLPIHPLLVELLSSPNAIKATSDKSNFNKLFGELKLQLNILREADPNLNVSNYLLNNSLKPEINSVANISNLRKEIKAQILLRKRLSEFLLSSWEQYENMALFIKTFWNIRNQNKLRHQNRGKEVTLDLFTCELKFDIESFKRRIKILRDNGEILDLSKRNSFPVREYPALGPLLDYILDPNEEADINRRKFVKFVCGTEYDASQILVILKEQEIPFKLNNRSKLYEEPFLAHTCYSTLDLFKFPSSGNYKEKYNVKRINQEIMKGTSLGAKNEF